MPTRIQRKRTPGFRLPPNTICINRGTKFGNPFKVSDYGREKTIQMFRDCLLNASMCYCYLEIPEAKIQYNRFIWMANNIHLIREADFIACFCGLDEACHGDCLIEISGIENDSAMCILSSLLIKKQDKNMNEEHEKQQDTKKHLLDKLSTSDAIYCSLCGGETTFLEPDKCMNIDCPNCIF